LNKEPHRNNRNRKVWKDRLSGQKGEKNQEKLRTG